MVKERCFSNAKCFFLLSNKHLHVENRLCSCFFSPDLLKRPQVRVGSAGGTLAQTLYFQGHINNVSYTWGILLTSAKVVIQVCLFGRHLFFKHKTRPHLSYWKCRHRSWGTEEEIGNVDLLKNWTLLCGSYWLQHVYTVSIQIFEFFLKKCLEFGCVSICQTQLN